MTSQLFCKFLSGIPRNSLDLHLLDSLCSSHSRKTADTRRRRPPEELSYDHWRALARTSRAKEHVSR
jgi:hypothetical protein